MNHLCPLCQAELKTEPEEIHPSHPTYRCPFFYSECFRKTHYIKYFEADWTYSRYREEAYVKPYRIVNIYDERKHTEYSYLEEEKYVRQGLMMNSRLVYVKLLNVSSLIQIPSQDNFINKIKTLLVFS